MKRKSAKKQQVVIDETILRELLEQPDVKGLVAQMTPETLQWFREFLIRDGIYAQYVKEREDSKHGNL